MSIAKRCLQKKRWEREVSRSPVFPSLPVLNHGTPHPTKTNLPLRAIFVVGHKETE
jgi:hypothetical protein